VFGFQPVFDEKYSFSYQPLLIPMLMLSKFRKYVWCEKTTMMSLLNCDN